MLAVIRGEEMFPIKHCSDTVPQLTEIYDFWHVRIKEDHLKYVEENVAHLIEANVVVQLQYPWIHPVYGEVMVRCSGRRIEDSDGMVTLEGYHRIISDIDER